MNYQDFLVGKSQVGGMYGFEPLFLPDQMFDFQKTLVDWALRKGRAAIFASTGMGKTIQLLTWAENVVRKTNKRVLVVTPLAVSYQTVREGEKFGIEATRSDDGKPHDGITVTNYERLHHFDANDFVGIVCDESSAIKQFTGERQKLVTEFARMMPYRLLCSATPSPNDYIELGTSSEALGELGRMDMLGTFFKNDENSLHPIQFGARWRFKKHAERLFWRWVCSWARAIRRPSDLGFDDGPYMLPPLIERETVVKRETGFNGQLFVLPAVGLAEQREERKMTIQERCEKVAELVGDSPSSITWCHYNKEGDILEKIIPGAKQISGSDSDEKKEELLRAFCDGELRVLVTKPSIAGFGMNFQHCAHMTFFPSHSFEQFHQSVRRCWRFGQTKPVVVDIVTTEGEVGVMKNLQRKAQAAEAMFDNLVAEMRNELRVKCATVGTMEAQIPTWLTGEK